MSVLEATFSATTLAKYDQNVVNSIGAEIQAAINQVCHKYGLKSTVKTKGKYDSNNFTLPTMILSLTAPAQASPLQLRLSGQLGFEKSLYGQTFEYQAKTWTIESIKPKNKMPIKAKNGNHVLSVTAAWLKIQRPDLIGRGGVLLEIWSANAKEQIFQRTGCDKPVGDGMQCPHCHAREIYANNLTPRDTEKWAWMIKPFKVDHHSHCLNCDKWF